MKTNVFPSVSTNNEPSSECIKNVKPTIKILQSIPLTQNGKLSEKYKVTELEPFDVQELDVDVLV